jgi:hypothetical protein
MMRWFVAVALLLLEAGAAQAELCVQRAEPVFVGDLDSTLIDEASGLAASRQYPDRLYHNNDSGDSGRFFITNLEGQMPRTVNVAGFSPLDAEDISVGPCPEGSCVYLGDTGDNLTFRRRVYFVVLREQETFAASETPLRTIVARYPDAPHDAEAFAVHPNGDLYLITKVRSSDPRRSGVAQVFRLTAEQLAAGGEQLFTKVIDLDLPGLLPEQSALGQLATGLDFSPDGSSAVLTTYRVAVEFAFDPKAPWTPATSWQRDQDFRVTTLPPLPQIEAIAYSADGGSLFIDTERTRKLGRAPLYRIDCSLTAAPIETH